MTLVDFTSEGHHYTIGLLEEEQVDTDPTLLLFRDDEEEAVATVHLRPGAPCLEPRTHIVLAKPAPRRWGRS